MHNRHKSYKSSLLPVCDSTIMQVIISPPKIKPKKQAESPAVADVPNKKKFKKREKRKEKQAFDNPKPHQTCVYMQV